MKQNITNNLQIFELKQLADMEAAYKDQCKKALTSYKVWHKKYADETDVIELLYGALEGDVLRHHAQERVRAYWTIRQDFRAWFARYMAAHQCYPANKKHTHST